MTVGLVAYSFALLAGLRAMLRSRLHSFFTAFSAAALFLIADLITNLRWHLHDWMVSEAMRRGIYDRRFVPQAVSLFILSLLALLFLTRLRRQLSGHLGAQLAAAGMVAALALWLVELISLHQVDAILYRQIGPLMTIAYIWIAAGAMMATGALRESSAC